LAVLSVETERQQGFVVFQMRRDEHSVAMHDRGTGSPAWQLYRPTDILGLAPADWEFSLVSDTIGVWTSPPWPIGTRLLGECQGTKHEHCPKNDRQSHHETPCCWCPIFPSRNGQGRRRR